MTAFFDTFEGWDVYAAKAANRPPRPLLVNALTLTSARQSAIDLGAGALTDTRYLLDQGFAQVTALDLAAHAQATADSFPPDRFTYAIASFENFLFPEEAYDVINAHYALPFIHPDAFDRVFGAVLGALKPGGLLVGQLFGDQDSWAGTPGMSFHSESAARALLSGHELLRFDVENEPDSHTLSGKSKHWHAFHLIVRRPA